LLLPRGTMSTFDVVLKRPSLGCLEAEEHDQKPLAKVARTHGSFAEKEPTLERVVPSEEVAIRIAPSTPPKSVVSLLQVSLHGPADFGGKIIEYLWDGVRVEYSAPIEYLLLCFPRTGKDRKKLDGSRRIIAPELSALLRCSRALRVGIITEIEVRRHNVEEQSDCRRIEEICDEVKNRYPKSWAVACRQSWSQAGGDLDAAGGRSSADIEVGL